MGSSADKIPPVVTHTNQVNLAAELAKKGVSEEDIETITSLVSQNIIKPEQIKDFSKNSLDRVAQEVKVLNASASPKNQEAKQINMESIASPQAIREATDKVVKLAEKDGHLWKCIDVEDNPGGGNIFTFTPYDKYNPLDERNDIEEVRKEVEMKNDEIFPAVEQSLEGVQKDLSIEEEYNLYCETFINKGRGFYEFYSEDIYSGPKNEVTEEIVRKGFEKEFSYISFYRELGISLEIIGEKPILKFPDTEALLVNLRKLREGDPKLEIVVIHTGKGIEEDLDFANAFAEGNDIVLSSGKEFLHDFMVHAIEVLRLLRTHELLERRELMQDLVKGPLEIIKFNNKMWEDKKLKNESTIIPQKELKRMGFFLGYFIDNVSTWDLVFLKGDNLNFYNFTRGYLNREYKKEVLENILIHRAKEHPDEEIWGDISFKDFHLRDFKTHLMKMIDNYERFEKNQDPELKMELISSLRFKIEFT